LDPFQPFCNKTKHHKSKSKKLEISRFGKQKQPGNLTHKPDKIAVEGCDLRSEDKKKSSLCWGVYAGLTGWEIQKFSTQKKTMQEPTS